MARIFICCVFACIAVVPLVTASGVLIDRLPVGFSWANCGAETLPGKIRNLSILPDPLLIPGEITVTTILAISVPLTSPVKIIVTAEKEVIGEWLKIPCLDNLGSCTYDNFCDILDQLIPPGQPCPEPLNTYGIPCHCPFQEGSYYLPLSTFEIPSLSIPSWLTKGNYRIKIVVKQLDQEIACANLTFTLDGSYL